MSRDSELIELLALDEALGGESPPGWGVFAAAEILGRADLREIQPQVADRVVGRLADLYWRAQFEGQQRRALELFSRIGGSAIAWYFLKAAGSKNARVREQSADALAELSGEGVLEALQSLLKDAEGSVRAAACLALGKKKDVSSAGPLMGALKDESGKVRRTAAEALGLLGDRRAVPALMEALGDLGIAVRKKAAEALGKIGDPAVLQALTERLRTGSLPERWNAAETLADWNAPEAVAPLAEALSDPSAKVRKRVTYALGNLPFPGAVDPLGKSLEDDSVEVRGRAAYALGLMGSPRAARYLVKALSDEIESVRKKAADSLAALVAETREADVGDAEGEGHLEEARKALRALLGGPDGELRFRSAFGLALCGDSGDPEPLDVVREAARSPESFFRRKALEVLGRAGGEGEVGILNEGMKDADPTVRRCAAEALGGIRIENETSGIEAEIDQSLARGLEDVDARVREAAYESWMRRRERKEREHR